MGEERDPLEEFETAWKAWAERPTRRSPGSAGRLVLEAGLRRQRRRRAIRTALATAALVVIALTLGVHRRGPEPPPPSAPPLASAPLGAGQALIWLDAETPLYMTFEAPQGGLP